MSVIDIARTAPLQSLNALCITAIQHSGLEIFVDFGEAVGQYRHKSSSQKLLCRYETMIRSVIPIIAVKAGKPR